ncbi:L-idonate 5-dehydrogenase [Trinickia caryophylli]|uniref:L-idonate 5-dehydrogenase n=1 Tax=Trinickia caryophylli TaxID=28094 RepID=A0A1X7G8D2_TRICW|nr:L-idonate 5-dehydrogenase [Trinickia caryophylli]PMS11421.1 L-idonate 5-dehydrogenase [Trinickia caryophylli]TRX17619.1 L-idonate 5-dehydrogenase [Trinickia caryophylli]WQE11628.1 L-idonate 5-dehydrogenase [Trinickia caryophylli]SMF65780.1 L-idonate 5-dehydrogenase [Trinickia caryophylli]GLU34807.1 L-idonate 5-dehydrogenase [Trinickia caryophylli]
MFAAVLHEPKLIRIDELERPEPRPGEVRVRIRAGGICGSDLSYYSKGKSGDFAVREPFVLGHEAAGEIDALGEGVTGLHIGERVAVNPGLACGVCRYCAAGMPNHCLDMRFMGSASTFPHSQGMFRQYIVAAARQCVPMPERVDFAAASMAEPLAVALHAIKRAGSLVGAQVLVVGCGPIGCLLLAVARRAGAHRLVALDLSEPALEMARRLGADDAFDAADDARIAQWSERRGTFDVVIEASGSPAGLGTALRAVRAGGTVLQVGNLPAGQSPVAANLVMAKEIQYVGSFRFADEYTVAAEEIAAGKIDVRAVMTHTFPLEQANRAFEVAQDRSRAMKVHLTFD